MKLQTMPLRFRVWDKKEKKFLLEDADLDEYASLWAGAGVGGEDEVISQDTGLKDKNGLHNIYGGDIIDSDGNIIGNLWQNESLLQDATNLLITGMGTSLWTATEQETIERGCKYAE